MRQKKLVQNTEKILCHMCSTFYAINSKQLAELFAEVHLDHLATDVKVSYITCPITKAFAGRKKVSGDILKKEKMVKVQIPGNGYCFLSSVIVTLGAIGIIKVDSVLCLEIVNEAKLYYKRVLETPVSTPEEKQMYIDQYSTFGQRGVYANDVVDYCIGGTANAIGVNLTIIHKESSGVYLLKQQHRCTRFNSKYNITLVYSTNTAKQA